MQRCGHTLTAPSMRCCDDVRRGVKIYSYVIGLLEASLLVLLGASLLVLLGASLLVLSGASLLVLSGASLLVLSGASLLALVQARWCYRTVAQ
jgi:hypothetical protein